MIAKIVKGSNFKGVVSYILDKEKGAKILVCDGLFADSKVPRRTNIALPTVKWQE